MSFPKQKPPASKKVLDDWLRTYANDHGLVESRLRRAISFMIVAMALERSVADDNEPLFLVKGGVSMELRLRLTARATKDLDTVFRGPLMIGWTRWTTR